MSSEPADIGIRDESIRLGQLLKLAGFVDDGATAREVIKAGAVTVNEEVDTRRGRQVRPGDLVAFAGQRVRVTGSSRGDRHPPDDESPTYPRVKT